MDFSKAELEGREWSYLLAQYRDQWHAVSIARKFQVS